MITYIIIYLTTGLLVALVMGLKDDSLMVSEFMGIIPLWPLAVLRFLYWLAKTLVIQTFFVLRDGLDYIKDM